MRRIIPAHRDDVIEAGDTIVVGDVASDVSIPLPGGGVRHWINAEQRCLEIRFREKLPIEHDVTAEPRSKREDPQARDPAVPPPLLRATDRFENASDSARKGFGVTATAEGTWPSTGGARLAVTRVKTRGRAPFLRPRSGLIRSPPPGHPPTPFGPRLLD